VHPGWQPGGGWEREVAAYVVETGEATLLLDPLVPPSGEDRFWDWLDALVEHAGVEVAVLLSRAGHFRSSQEIHDRYGALVYGNGRARERLDPVRDYRSVASGDLLPGDARALPCRFVYDETPLYLPSHSAVAVGDLILAVGGELRVWWVAESDEDIREYHEEHVPGMRAWLELPIEHILVSHGEYVSGGGDALTAAFGRPPWDVS
jgi:hypothetical protein